MWVRTFRSVAVAEALSWCGLLAGMFVKHVLDRGDRGVDVFGRIHGVVVLVYVVAVLAIGKRRRWNSRIVMAGLLASVPPLGSLLFERWATRHGLLGGTVPGLSWRAAPRRPAASQDRA